MGVHCCICVNYIVYTHFYWSLHVGSSDPTDVQNFRPVPSTFPIKYMRFVVVYKHLPTLGHQSLGVCEVSYTYLLVCLRF